MYCSAEHITPNINRFRLEGRNDGVDFHPLQRGGKVFLASRVSLENLEGVTTYSRIPNSCAHLEFISGSSPILQIGKMLKRVQHDRVFPDSRLTSHDSCGFNLSRYCSFRKAQTQYLPLLRGEGRGEVLTVVTQSLNHSVTLSASREREVLVW